MVLSSAAAERNIAKNRKYLAYYKKEKAAGRTPKTAAQFSGKGLKRRVKGTASETGSIQHRASMKSLPSGLKRDVEKMRDSNKRKKS